MKKLLLLSIFLASFTTAKSQEYRKFLFAKVNDKFGAVSNAHVINLNTNKGTFTNQEGKFKILAKTNDSLRISFLGYKTKIEIVTIDDFGMQEKKIQLTKTPINLDEVDVKKNNLLGTLIVDTKNIKSNTKNQVNAETLNLPYAGSRILTQAERRLHTAMTSGSGLPIDPLINWISGRIKLLKKYKAIEDLEKKVTHINDNYAIHIINQYKIKEEDIYRFIYFCVDDKEFNQAYTSTKMTMITFLKEKTIEFKKLNSNNY